MHTLRLGEIGFINALPLSLPYESLAEIQLEKSILPPTGLNQAMLEGRLDVSPVSSAFYLRHQDRFSLLEGISISAEYPVESVLLFLPGGFSGIHAETCIAVPDSSETSIALMQYTVFQNTGFKLKDTLIPFPAGSGAKQLLAGKPLLAIGDEALKLKRQFASSGMDCLDLAEYWQQQTGLPFVFAVWIAQKTWALENPELLMLLNRLLVEQKQTFQHDDDFRQRILLEASKRCPDLSQPVLDHYFTKALSYNLDRNHFRAMARFGEILKWLDDDRYQGIHGNSPQLSIELLHR